ncbi:MAG: MBOAT family O-acyltransferase [Bacteroidota bacterium]
MEITSLFFILLFFVSIFIYYLLGHRYRALFLTILSYLYIATFSVNLFLYVFFYSLVNYVIGMGLSTSKYKNLVFRIGIIINLSQLILLQYASFAINPVFQMLHISWDATILSGIIVPIGISFFTLQGIGYLINIQLGWEKPERNFIHFLLYIGFFPRFLSGPIDRSNHFLPQIKTEKSFSEDDVTEGLRLVLSGLFKKIVIANFIGVVIHQVYADAATSNEHALWIVMLVQPFYIYFDFSAYTEIALGIARTFGLKLRPNFNRPFLAENVSMFWKRFHMSLSSWFHDYIFMRFLFRFRKWSKHVTTFALFLTWTLFGIWHGAGWNFMVLGFLQALVIFYEFRTKKWRVKFFSLLPDFYRKWLGRISTYMFFSFSLVFFFSHDLRSAFVFFSRIFQHTSLWTKGILDDLFVLGLILAFMLFEIIQNDYSKSYHQAESFLSRRLAGNRWIRWAIYLAAIVIIKIFNYSSQQFIYFQF